MQEVVLQGNTLHQKEVIESGKPFKIITASGKEYEIPHQDFVHFSSKKTTLFVFWEEGNEE